MHYSANQIIDRLNDDRAKLNTIMESWPAAEVSGLSSAICSQVSVEIGDDLRQKFYATLTELGDVVNRFEILAGLVDAAKQKLRSPDGSTFSIG